MTQPKPLARREVLQTAAALGISVATLHRELRVAKAWLMKAISSAPHDS